MEFDIFTQFYRLKKVEMILVISVTNCHRPILSYIYIYNCHRPILPYSVDAIPVSLLTKYECI